MAAKLPKYTILQGQQSDSPGQTQENIPRQGYLPQQCYQLQQGSYPPQQASYPPQQASYPPQQASYPPQQTSYPLQQTRDPPHQGSYPPQQGYSPAPPHQPQTTTIPIREQPIVAEPVYVTYGEWPVTTVCPSCQVSVETTVHHTPGATALLCCVVLFCIGCSLGCCLVPFCNHDCLDVVHACPICKNQIAIYQRSI